MDHKIPDMEIALAVLNDPLQAIELCINTLNLIGEVNKRFACDVGKSCELQKGLRMEIQGGKSGNGLDSVLVGYATALYVTACLVVIGLFLAGQIEGEKVILQVIAWITIHMINVLQRSRNINLDKVIELRAKLR